jgi:hypothetical protein
MKSRGDCPNELQSLLVPYSKNLTQESSPLFQPIEETLPEK